MLAVRLVKEAVLPEQYQITDVVGVTQLLDQLPALLIMMAPLADLETLYIRQTQA